MKSRGEVYSKIFRKAGIAWGKNNVQQAIALVQEGLELATEQGDTEAACVFQLDLERYQSLAQDGDTKLSP